MNEQSIFLTNDECVLTHYSHNMHTKERMSAIAYTAFEFLFLFSKIGCILNANLITLKNGQTPTPFCLFSIFFNHRSSHTINQLPNIQMFYQLSASGIRTRDLLIVSLLP